MSKRLKMLTASLLLACIMVASFAGAALADHGYNGNCNAYDVGEPTRAQDGSCQD